MSGYRIISRISLEQVWRLIIICSLSARLTKIPTNKQILMRQPIEGICISALQAQNVCTHGIGGLCLCALQGLGELQAPQPRAQCADEEQRQRASPDKRPRKHNTHEQ